MWQVVIFYHSDKAGAEFQARQLKKRLAAERRAKFILSDLRERTPKNLSARINLAISVGGDGTLLKVSHLMAPLRIPVLGINIGHLGFLAEAEKQTAARIIRQIFQGQYSLEERMLLKAVLVSKNKLKKNLGIALNDCVIRSYGTGHPIRISAWVENNFLTSYHGDGLIIATPTGSTAYSLAAAGPIVHPHLELFLLTPICPHTLAQRPLLISATHSIKIKSPDAGIFLDGNYAGKLAGELVISKYEHPLMLVRHPHLSYLDILRTKLGWGER